MTRMLKTTIFAAGLLSAVAAQGAAAGGYVMRTDTTHTTATRPNMDITTLITNRITTALITPTMTRTPTTGLSLPRPGPWIWHQAVLLLRRLRLERAGADRAREGFAEPRTLGESPGSGARSATSPPPCAPSPQLIRNSRARLASAHELSRTPLQHGLPVDLDHSLARYASVFLHTLFRQGEHNDP